MLRIAIHNTRSHLRSSPRVEAACCFSINQQDILISLPDDLDRVGYVDSEKARPAPALHVDGLETAALMEHIFTYPPKRARERDLLDSAALENADIIEVI